MYKNFTLIATLLLSIFQSQAQTIVWQDDFENPANWNLNVANGVNALDANLWVISDAEGGVAAGGCGVASNGNKTLHISCQGSWCAGTGAIYNAGDGGLGFFDCTTHKRALMTSNINTQNTGSLTLSFDYIGIGQAGFDFGKVIYSIDAGLTWTNLQLISPAGTCAGGQGLWTNSSLLLPPNCYNITTLRLGFQWENDNDGAGSDPSLALNNLKITYPSNPTVSAAFNLNQNGICPDDCINMNNVSVGATTYFWDFGNGTNSTLSNPTNICFSTPGTYNVNLIACNGLICDTVSEVLIVNNYLFGQQSITANNTYTWPFNGQTYTQSGVYTDTISNANSCDSISTLTLQLLNSGLGEQFLPTRSLLKIVDLTGREVAEKKNILLFYIYSDGSTERIFIVE
jgi:hypothetical protein